VSRAEPRASTGAIGGRARITTPIGSRWVRGLVFALFCIGLSWIVWIYGNSLRDPRYLDGWVLACGMGLQLYFHIARKRATLTPRSASRWRTRHIWIGLFLIVAFVLHSDFTLPDTVFEWALWIGFMLVAVSGIFGTCLAWWIEARRLVDEGVVYERIPERRTELARAAKAAVAAQEASTSSLDLPAPPYDAWIADLYTAHLQDFFAEARNTLPHLIGSRRPLTRLTDEIDDLSRFVDRNGREKLADIKELAIEKNKLDIASAYLGMSRAWLLVHVPATYALIVLVILHGLVVYAFSAGVW
jgi:hypothetical protein